MNGSSSTQKTTGLLDLRLERRRLECSPMELSVQNTRQWVKACVVFTLLLLGAREASASIQTGRPFFKLKHHRATLRALQFDSSGQRLASLDRDGNLAIWGLKQGGLLDITRLRTREVRSVAFTDRLQYALIGTDLGVVQWVRATDGSPMVEWRDPRVAVSQVAIGNDEEQLLWSSRQGRLWRGRLKGSDLQATSLKTRFNELIVALVLRTTREGVEGYVGLADGRVVHLDLVADRVLNEWKAHSSRVTCLNLSNNQRYLTSCGRDGGVSVWAAESGQPVNAFKGHPESALEAVISPRNGAVRSLGAEGTIRTWSRRSDSESDLRYIGKVGLAVAMHGAPDWVAMSTWDNTIEVWRSADAFKSKSLELRSEAACAVELGGGAWGVCDGAALRRWDPIKGTSQVLTVGDSKRMKVLLRSGSNLVLAGEDRMVRVWSTKRRRELWRSERLPETPSSGALNNAGNVALIGTESGQLYKLSLKSRAYELSTLGRHRDEVTTIAWDDQGKHWLTAGADRSVLVWDEGATGIVRGWRDLPEVPLGVSVDRVGGAWVGIGRELWRYEIATGRGIKILEAREVIGTLRTDPGGEWVILGRRDGYIDLVNTTKVDEVRTLWGHRGTVNQLYLSRRRNRLVSLGGDGRVQMMDVKLGQERLKWQASQAPVSVVLPMSKRRLMTIDRQRKVALWNLTTGEREPDAFEVDIEWLSAAIDSKRKTLALGTTDGRIFVYDAQSFELRGVIDAHDGRVQALGISPNGKFLASGGKDGFLKLWSVQSLNFKTDSEFEHGVTALDWGPKGKTLAVAVRREVRILNASSLELKRTLGGHQHLVSSVRFSPRAKSDTLVSGGFDLSARAWNIKRGKELWLFGGNGGGIQSVDFSPDGEWVTTAGDDGEVKTYSLVSGQPQLRFIGHKGRVLDVSLGPDGKSIISCGEDGTVRVWSTD